MSYYYFLLKQNNFAQDKFNPNLLHDFFPPNKWSRNNN